MKILPPTPAPEIKDGFERHQFILVLDDESYQKLCKIPLGVYDFLYSHWGHSCMLAEKVMEGEMHGWHVWMDYPKEEIEKYFSDQK
jgi:hypothetical protein